MQNHITGNTYGEYDFPFASDSEISAAQTVIRMLGVCSDASRLYGEMTLVILLDSIWWLRVAAVRALT